MISAALKASEARSFTSRIADVPNWAWWLLALSFIALKSWSVSGTGVFGNLGDSDDATRLIQVRELLASGHWFDTTTMKLGGNAGMLSHWSRLIDLPLATLIAGFSLVMPVRSAEWLTHIVWPVTLLGALLWVVYRTTAKIAGESAGRMALLLAVMSPFAYYQFAVGRIDHHNVMIAAAVSAVLLIWSNPQRTDIWRIAGVLTGVAVAVGYEALSARRRYRCLCRSLGSSRPPRCRTCGGFCHRTGADLRSRIRRNDRAVALDGHPLRRDLAEHGGVGLVRHVRRRHRRRTGPQLAHGRTPRRHHCRRQA